jgi:hypothetical protein
MTSGARGGWNEFRLLALLLLVLPAHQLQAAHGVKGQSLIRLIKVWARGAGRRDEEIFDLPHDPDPAWPWPGQRQRAKRFGKSIPPTHSS